MTAGSHGNPVEMVFCLACEQGVPLVIFDFSRMPSAAKFGRFHWFLGYHGYCGHPEQTARIRHDLRQALGTPH